MEKCVLYLVCVLICTEINPSFSVKGKSNRKYCPSYSLNVDGKIRKVDFKFLIHKLGKVEALLSKVLEKLDVEDVQDEKEMTGQGVNDQQVTEEGIDDQKVTEQGVNDQKVTEEGVDDQKMTEQGVNDQKVTEKGVDDQKMTEQGVNDQKVTEEGVDDQKMTEQDVDDEKTLAEQTKEHQTKKTDSLTNPPSDDQVKMRQNIRFRRDLS